MENSELVTKALRYIRAETENSGLTIEDIAEHAGFSTDYFNRIFLAHTGFNVMEYLRSRRLINAAMQLRTTNEKVLDIALQNGYETHESFSRAFKKQYGVSPTEYRKKNIKNWTSFREFCDVTVLKRMTHEFKSLSSANVDEVVLWLLEKDAIKYGCAATALFKFGGSLLYIGDDFHDGLVRVTERRDGFRCAVICDDEEKTAEYLKTFADDRFHVVLYTLDDDETITEKSARRGIEVTSIDRRYEYVYCGEPFDAKAPDGIFMRELKYEDAYLLDRFKAKRNKKLPVPITDGCKASMYLREVVGAENIEMFCFGIFNNDEMIGFSTTHLQQAYGFCLNHAAQTFFLDGCENESLYEYAFKYVTDWGLEKGALPLDASHSGCAPEYRFGNFEPDDFGYELSICRCGLKYRLK